MKLEDQIALVAASGVMDAGWYAARHPDVALSGMDPVEHYLKYGVLLGRDPGPGFHTDHYLRTYPEVGRAGFNPLVHWLLHGRAEGRPGRAPDDAEIDAAERDHARLLRKLTTLGLTDPALAELRARAADPGPDRTGAARAVLAARTLAQWHMRRAGAGDAAEYDKALTRIAECRRAEGALAALADRPGLDVIEILALQATGRTDAARGVLDRAMADGIVAGDDPAGLDILLAAVGLEPGPAARVAAINDVMARTGLAPLTLLEDGATPYDRLDCQIPPADGSGDGPRVSVLMAAHNSAATITTALGSLARQSWRNLEILVIDDASTDATCDAVRAAAVRDPRIRLIPLSVNGGAYVARNRGLIAATGEFVTVHDADDWAHPARIERQVRHLRDHPGAVGCTSRQARMGETLTFPRWTGQGGNVRILRDNVASFLFRRAPVQTRVGPWDDARFGADSGLMRRCMGVFGAAAVAKLATGPLVFQRLARGSITSDDRVGYDGFLFGARQDYHEALGHDIATRGDGPAAPPGTRSGTRVTPPVGTGFPLPALMRPDRASIGDAYDVILASDFRMVGGSTRSSIAETGAQKAAGLRTGIVQMYRYDYDVLDPAAPMMAGMRAMIDGDSVRTIVHGEAVSCDLLILRYPPILQHRHRYLPRIDARAVKVIVNQTPMSDYSGDGVVRYDIPACSENLGAMFGDAGRAALWHPIGPLARKALTDHHAADLARIHLADADWNNVIDLSGWEGPRRRPSGGRLRIGRHSRDMALKWPATRDGILAVYPAGDAATADIEVHVLGGADAATALIGGTPGNWRVHPFGAMPPRDFLAGIDVFVYFTHPGLVESFGRSIVEAMAAGVPVVLPHDYRLLFGDAASYAAPADAVAVSRALYADRAAYAAQAERARRMVAGRFSYSVHLDRLRRAGVGRDGRDDVGRDRHDGPGR